MAPEAPWKRIEREEARKLGGKRIPIGTPGAPDVESDWLCVEIKARKRLPTWIKEALRSARAKAKDNQLGIVSLHEMREHDSLILISRDDFINWFGEGRGAK